jgi:hypothetical protein
MQFVMRLASLGAGEKIRKQQQNGDCHLQE